MRLTLEEIEQDIAEATVVYDAASAIAKQHRRALYALEDRVAPADESPEVALLAGVLLRANLEVARIVQDQTDQMLEVLRKQRQAGYLRKNDGS